MLVIPFLLALAAAEPRPNILLIIADDIGMEMLEPFGEADPDAPSTPHLDALAADSVRFTSCYSQPSCSPTRATLLTGRHGFRTGVGAVISSTDRFALPFSELTIPKLLDVAGSGYDHTAIGKWHLGSHQSGHALNPVLHGFRHFAGILDNTTDYLDWTKSYAERGGHWVQHPSHRYLTIDQTDDALRAAEHMAEPWFLWVGYSAAHAPFHTPPPHLHSQQDPSTDRDRYRAMIESLDHEVGRLLVGLGERRERTVVLFVSDNGTPAPVSLKPLSKGSLAEAGINVPFLISGPVVPRSRQGTLTPALASTTDVFATVADIAGIDLTQLSARPVLDSVSLLPVLQDPTATVRSHAFVDSFRPNGFGPYQSQRRTIRDSRWKLKRVINPRDEFFYDLKNAPPGEDGPILCFTCPFDLGPFQRRAWDRLDIALQDLLER